MDLGNGCIPFQGDSGSVCISAWGDSICGCLERRISFGRRRPGSFPPRPLRREGRGLWQRAFEKAGGGISSGQEAANPCAQSLISGALAGDQRIAGLGRRFERGREDHGCARGAHFAGLGSVSRGAAC